MSSWDDEDGGEELRPLKPFRSAPPRAPGRSRPRPDRPGTRPVPGGRRGPAGNAGHPRPSGPGPARAGGDESGSTGGPGRGIVLGAATVVALLLLVLVVGSCRFGDDDRNAEAAVVERFLAAYAARDYGAMFAEIDADAQRTFPVRRFAGLNRDAFRMATVRFYDVGGAGRRGARAFEAPVTVRTKRFGSIVSELRLRLVGRGEDARIAWTRNLVFPGLRRGERLSRVARIPPRGTILFRDGRTPIARGAGRTSTAPAQVTSQIRGELGPIPDEELAKYRELGIPATTKVGKSGLERLLDDRLIGRPELRLKAGSRVVARGPGRRAKAVVASVSLPVMQAAVQAQASAPSGGGLFALDASTGEVLAFAGDAWTGPRAPGSTMKIVTAAAALASGEATTGSDYPAETSALGIQNADGEACGGSLVEAFAASCNSVFAPLALRVGSTPFVRMAEAFGFNRAPAVDGASRSTVPDDLADGDLALSGIGQARVQATPLQVAMMAATVATGGVQPALTFRRREDAARTRRVVEVGVAEDLRRMMRAVVTEGTGTAAGLPGIAVAGKTGTAEVRTTQGPACRDGDALGDGTADAAEDPGGDAGDPLDADPVEGGTLCDPADSTDTDAWMAAFAPAAEEDGSPVAVGVLRRGDGRGAATAAPVARAVLEAALRP